MRTIPYDSTWPSEWAGQRRSGLLLFGAVFLGLITLGIVTAALAQVTREDAVSALIFLAIAVYFGHLAALCFHAYSGGRPRTSTIGVREDSTGLVFTYGAVPTYLLTAFLGMTTIALILMAVFSAAQGTTQGYVVTAVLILLALFIAVVLAVVLRLAPGRVVVGPDGVHHRGLTFTHFVPWEAVTDVAALWAHSPVVFIRTIGSSATVTRNYLGRNTPGPQTLSPFDTISGRWLAADPGLLLQTLAHYIVHPADRRELGQGSALNRIAAP
ncbi:PH domain-containing protein [Actinoplanes solisilvae]|uniref:PH domain-containing protein n=1 Tax=Actinoplanes solisilvae TaxID=2486853 RepID=UPI0013E34D36|nr:PH domain-containing protein [Actinoplanes solisilvae]